MKPDIRLVHLDVAAGAPFEAAPAAPRRFAELSTQWEV